MGKPASMRPIGQMPKPGYDSPRFPTVGPKDVSPPPGGYTSIISTAAPVDAGQTNRIANVRGAARLSNLKDYARAIGNAEGQSREAFSRAMQDTSSGAIRRAIDKYNKDYQKQAEKSRSEDLLAQRQNALDRFRQDLYAAIFGEDTKTRYVEGEKDLNQYYETEKKNEQAKRTAMILSFIGGLI